MSDQSFFISVLLLPLCHDTALTAADIFPYIFRSLNTTTVTTSFVFLADFQQHGFKLGRITFFFLLLHDIFVNYTSWNGQPYIALIIMITPHEHAPPHE